MTNNQHYFLYMFLILYTSFMHASFFHVIENVSTALVRHDARDRISELIQQTERACSEAIWTEIETYISEGGSINDRNIQQKSFIEEAIEHRYFGIVARLLNQPDIDLSVPIALSILQSLEQEQYALFIAQHYTLKKPQEHYLENYLSYAYACLGCFIKWYDKRTERKVITSSKDINLLLNLLRESLRIQLVIQSYNQGKHHAFLTNLLKKANTLEIKEKPNEEENTIVETKNPSIETTLHYVLNISKNSFILAILILYWYHIAQHFEIK